MINFLYELKIELFIIYIGYFMQIYICQHGISDFYKNSFSDT